MKAKQVVVVGFLFSLVVSVIQKTESISDHADNTNAEVVYMQTRGRQRCDPLYRYLFGTCGRWPFPTRPSPQNPFLPSPPRRPRPFPPPPLVPSPPPHSLPPIFIFPSPPPPVMVFPPPLVPSPPPPQPPLLWLPPPPPVFTLPPPLDDFPPMPPISWVPPPDVPAEDTFDQMPPPLVESPPFK